MGTFEIPAEEACTMWAEVSDKFSGEKEIPLAVAAAQVSALWALVSSLQEINETLKEANHGRLDVRTRDSAS